MQFLLDDALTDSTWLRLRLWNGWKKLEKHVGISWLAIIPSYGFEMAWRLNGDQWSNWKWCRKLATERLELATLYSIAVPFQTQSDHPRARVDDNVMRFHFVGRTCTVHVILLMTPTLDEHLRETHRNEWNYFGFFPFKLNLLNSVIFLILLRWNWKSPHECTIQFITHQKKTHNFFRRGKSAVFSIRFAMYELNEKCIWWNW